MPKQSETGVEIPTYGERPQEPGLYLAMLHGRGSPDEQMSDWGYSGPLIGPLNWCHTTYATEIKIEFKDNDCEARYFRFTDSPHCHVLQIHNDLLVYARSYYGDWTVFYVGADEVEPPKDNFRDAARRNRLPPVQHSTSERVQQK